MASYPTYDAAALSEYSGRDAADYAAYGQQAYTQATLLFKIGTCLAQLPDDGLSYDLAKMAILAMADAIVLSQPYQKVLANPFTSESIGSYSYSKMATKVAAGLPSGIDWFDLALSKLSVCDQLDGVPSGGGIEVFESDGLFGYGVHSGNIKFLSPKDLDLSRSFGYDPAPRYGGIPVTDGESNGIDLSDFTQDGGLLES